MAEDHADNQVVIRAMLEHLGVACVLESDGERAVSRFELEAKRIDAVLMDVHMPVLDGLAATARIRELEHRCSLAPKPIIAMTASAFS
ncbi:response regulator, partial [Arthrospira platensis SPKY2]